MSGKASPDRSPKRNKDAAEAQLVQVRLKLIAAGKEDKATKVLAVLASLRALDVETGDDVGTEE